MRIGSLLALSLSLLACAGPDQPRETTPVARRRVETYEDPLTQVSRRLEQGKGTVDQPKALAQHDERGEKASRKVGVQGLHGTLSSYDVKHTLEKRNKAFAACHEPRARQVPALAGGVAFEIRVQRSGAVADVLVRRSDLGDRVLERCFSEVILDTRFPAPHGGEATVEWQMALEPAELQHAPEALDSQRVERVVERKSGGLLAACDVAGGITVTAYVSRRGKVLAAGVAAPDDRSAESLDCIADELRTWSMPRPRKGIAKVSFALRR